MHGCCGPKGCARQMGMALLLHFWRKSPEAFKSYARTFVED